MALIGEETMEQLRDLIKAVNDKDAEQKEDQLLRYMELVLERNQHVNLTAITDRDEFIRKHYIDSLAAAALPEFQAAETVIDLGTGGGFPGVPLAIVFPEKEFVLMDSLAIRGSGTAGRPAGVLRGLCFPGGSGYARAGRILPAVREGWRILYRLQKR